MKILFILFSLLVGVFAGINMLQWEIVCAFMALIFAICIVADAIIEELKK